MSFDSISHNIFFQTDQTPSYAELGKTHSKKQLALSELSNQLSQCCAVKVSHVFKLSRMNT